jgi:hypothetical protein
MRHINDLKEGRRRDGSGLNWQDTRDSDEAVYMFENARRFGRCQNTGGGNKDAGLGVHRMFKNDVRANIILEVVIYISEHSWRC